MKIPCHIPSLPKPQNQYNFQIDNSNLPFTHPWLRKTGGPNSHPIHPASPFSPLDFALVPSSHKKPLPIESTPFTYVDNVDGLTYLASKLREANDFAVDLEHNSYRSYQGITCLMQISTRAEDFIVDTLKLRDHVGPYLREFFQDPAKRKVMHGASNDVLWLQRDFGIYVCNLFDTMQASKILELERNSLEFLLKHYCNVMANKEYQTSDWRLRPLPYQMIKYAREDTHHLIYIHDMMLKKLVDSKDTASLSRDPLAEVFEKSYEVSVQMYKKEVLNYSISYLHLYGLSEANLDAKQLAVVAALYEWRDKLAREADESTGYILPNKLMLKIAMELPTNKKRLLQITGSDKEHLVTHADLLAQTVRHYVRDDSASSKFDVVAKLMSRKTNVSEIAKKVLEDEKRIKDCSNVWNQNCNRDYQRCLNQPDRVYIPVTVHHMY